MGILGVLMPLLGNLFSQVLGDTAAATQCRLKLLEMEKEGQLREIDDQFQMSIAQMGVNQAEATSGSFFQSGWRPLVGWGCALTFVVTNLLSPLICSFLMLLGFHPTPLHTDIASTTSILMALLGIASLRTYDKTQIMNKQVLFATLKQQLGPLNERQVSVVEKAVDAGLSAGSSNQ